MAAQNESIQITTEFIKLDQLLKFSGVAAIGSEAKSIIADGIVSVNGEPCTMRGKKIRPGDVVRIKDGDYDVCLTITD
ncbi:MAG: RNA-binding S4 domain-containing protein [Huintestinicola sp.]